MASAFADPNHQILFHELTRELGGREDVNRPDTALAYRQILEAHRSRVEDWLSRVMIDSSTKSTAPKVHFDYIASYALTAYAFERRSANVAFIGVPVGTVFLLRDFFLRLMARPTILPMIGDIRQEPAVDRDSPGRSWREVAPHGHFSGQHRWMMLNQPIQPQNGVRIDCALHLADLAMDFITHHEFAHLRFGHLRLPRTQATTSTTAALDEVGDSGFEPIDHQALEYTADVYAVAQGIHSLIRRLANGVMPSVYASAQYAFEVWTTAIYTLFALLGRSRTLDEGRPLLSRHYPPPHMRQLMILGRVSDILQPRGAVSSISDEVPRVYDVLGTAGANIFEDYRTVYAQAVGRVEHAFMEITGVPPDKDDLQLARHPEGRKHVTRVLLQYQRIQPLLAAESWGTDLLPRMPAEVEAEHYAMLA